MVQSVLREIAVRHGHSSTKLTYADYLRFPDDGLRHEIIDGEHYVSAAPTIRHQRIASYLLYLLYDFLISHPLGEVFIAPVDVVLSDTNVVVPDLIYVSNERAKRLTEKHLQGSPDLTVEILSPSTRPRDQRLKRDVYERLGVNEYWIVDPDSDVIVVYRRGDEGFDAPVTFTRGDVLTTPLLPGLELSVERVFR